MIVFGGLSATGTVSGSVFILELKTLAWNKGTDVPQTQSRSAHSCATNGNSFIAWGGKQRRMQSFQIILVYINLTKPQMVILFDRPELNRGHGQCSSHLQHPNRSMGP